MKPYDELDITDLVLEGDSDAISRLEAEIQDRDKAIVELFMELEECYLERDMPDDERHSPHYTIEKYRDFAYKTRAIYGM